MSAGRAAPAGAGPRAPRSPSALVPHLPYLGSLLALLLLLWGPPLAGARVTGHPLSDVSDHLWGAWWWGGELLAGRLPLRAAQVHLPSGTELWYVDPVGAALALLLRPLGFPLAFELALLLSALGGALAAYAVAWERERHAGAALLAGLLVGGSPYLLGLLHSGLSEYAGLAFPVLFTGALLRAVEGRGRAWVAGLLLGLCALQAFYYGLFAALLALLALAGAGPCRRLRAVGTTLAVGLPLALLPWLLARGTLEGAASSLAPGWRQASLPALDASLFLRHGPRYFPDTPALGNPGILQVHALSWVALGLGLWGFARRPALRPHRLAALLYALASLGPALAWNGRPVLLGGRPVLLPLALLYRLPGSPWRSVHHPYRLEAFLLVLLALGAAAAVARWRWPGWGALLGGLALLEAALPGTVPWPLARTPCRPPAIYAELPPGGVLDWPPDATDWNRRYERWQVFHRRPIPYGVNAFLPAELARDPLVAELLGALDDPRARARNRDVPLPWRSPPARPGPSRPAGLGLASLVMHVEALGAGELERSLGVALRWLGPPAWLRGGEAAWPLPPSLPRPRPAGSASAPARPPGPRPGPAGGRSRAGVGGAGP